MNLQQAWRFAASQLPESDSATLDAQLLLLHAIGKDDRAYLMTWPEKALSTEQISEFNELLARRKNGEPIAHILGKKEFWGLALNVNASTLIPRPDTEILVESVINNPVLSALDSCKLLDLGTGTGAIALAIKSERPSWTVDAVEYNVDAFHLAQKNASQLNIDISIHHGSWYQAIPKGGKFNAIVSNPPYIEANDVHLQQGDVRFEPLSALVAPDHGLADIKKIVEQGLSYLVEDGWIYLEHGFQQGAEVRQILLKNGFKKINTISDLAGKERITCGCK
ncbi:peptide chain release factor N(5)-glutamine methyltransferase [Catenovulum sediminis]|uniref:Release factor glutamine methyltransferase n=1 Tax=Catenovulum sediminis TaxID=1740262 RepID=A0ABV1RKQ4_9ALTE|nr:peptide chain release factor N(5)-glutamine methyltransferase [Catenovulum sediminis]